MRKILATTVLWLGASVAGAPGAAALNRRPEPPGAQVVQRVARTLFPVLPPNPCVRIPSLPFADNPVLPPNPCLSDGRGR